MRAVAAFLLVASVGADKRGQCAWGPGECSSRERDPHQQLDLTRLPGFTRGGYYADHALITPESRVYAGLFGWRNSTGAVLVSPKATSAHFTMTIVNMGTSSLSAAPLPGVERFVLVMEGEVHATAGTQQRALKENDFAYFPPGQEHSFSSSGRNAVLLMYEQMYIEPSGAMAGLTNGSRPQLLFGATDEQPLIPVSPEIFALRKLLPTSAEYDFNIHVMDFEPGEYLLVKEIHYNQHGLLLLEGQGIYRLADSWYPVTAGDAIWMAPFVVQWYGALGKTRSRYIINKDTNRDPLQY